MTLTDIQIQPDERGVAIEDVGISGLRYPIGSIPTRRGWTPQWQGGLTCMPASLQVLSLRDVEH